MYYNVKTVYSVIVTWGSTKDRKITSLHTRIDLGIKKFGMKNTKLEP